MKYLLLISLFIFNSCSLFDMFNDICALRTERKDCAISPLDMKTPYICFEDDYNEDECRDANIGECPSYVYYSYNEFSSCSDFCSNVKIDTLNQYPEGTSWCEVQ